MDQQTARFRFYEELNDFLRPEQKKRTFSYRFTGTPSIKDAIEAVGVPHTEVDLILVNGQSVDFGYRLQDGDRVSVYPVFESLDITPAVRLRPAPLRRTAFILDTQLGKLARRLRMLGFDTLYRNDYKDAEIIRTAQEERRIILTRDVDLLKNKSVTHGYWVRSASPEKQVGEVLRRLDLYGQITPFSRCLVCNGLVVGVDKAAVEDRLPPRTRRYFETFYACQACGKVYWEGSHYRRMKDQVERIRRNAHDDR